MSEQKHLTRNTSDRMLGGVCSGLARYLAIDPLLVRVAFVALAVINGVGVLIYIMLWIIIPDEKGVGVASEQTVRDNASDMAAQLRGVARSINLPRGSVIVGVVLIAVGAFALLRMFVPGLTLGMFGPLLLIGAGLYVLMARRR